MKIFYPIIIAFLSCITNAKDLSHYPYENFAYTGYQLGVYNSVAGVIPLSASANVDASFNLGELQVLNEAMKVLVEYALKSEVIDCAYKNSSKDFPESKEKFKSQLYEVFTWRHMNDLFYPGNFYISQFHEYEDVAGLGYMNLFYDKNKPLPGYKDKHYIHIALNSDYIGDEDQYSLSTNSKYWAGVIAHEMLHNLGYDHPSGYVGSFIKEFGNCVWKTANKTNIDLDFNEEVLRRSN